MQIELNAAVTLFEDPIDFSNYIENEVYKTNKTYLDAILDYCKSRYIDPEDIKPLISTTLKSKVANDFANLGYFKQEKSLHDFFE
jgi:hypothetical protein